MIFRDRFAQIVPCLDSELRENPNDYGAKNEQLIDNLSKINVAIYEIKYDFLFVIYMNEIWYGICCVKHQMKDYIYFSSILTPHMQMMQFGME